MKDTVTDEEKRALLDQFVNDIYYQISIEKAEIEAVPHEHRCHEEHGTYTALQREQKFLESLKNKPKAYILATLQRITNFATGRQDTIGMENAEIRAEIRTSQRYGERYKSFIVVFRATQERRTSGRRT